jgi:REP element-mobilizing transposase RayT
MPRRKVQFIQGGYYHIYNRGAGRQAILKEPRNYEHLLRRLKQIAQECFLTVIAYCLLPNHYHWLIRQDGDVSAGKLPTRVFGSYTQAFNKAYGHTGTLFEGPYQAIAVTRDVYLEYLCAYIHLNPVRHGLVETPDTWVYSNYPEWIGTRQGTLYDPGFVRERFEMPQGYQAYVQSLLNGEIAPPRGEQVYTFQEA